LTQTSPFPDAERARGKDGGVDLVEALLFRDIPATEARAILDRARRRVFARGEVVYHEGDPGETLHLIADGRFMVRVSA
jgi:CRP-like cAMP-binding protein